MSSTPQHDEDTASESTRVFQLGEEFLASQRRGERPQIADYCEQHPEVAAELRELLLTIQMMESLPEDSPAVTDPLSELKGKTLGDYRLVRLIGQGGMGFVYEAQQLSLQRRVAVKILRHAGEVGEQTRQRFLREAKAIAKLHHTNIVPIYEIAEEEATSFFAMQLIDGVSLDRLISRLSDEPGGGTWKRYSTADERQDETAAVSSPNPLRVKDAELPRAFEIGKPPEHREVAEMMLQAARALEHAHERGIVHRDVKPSNLILDRQGVVWLTDFGLAKTEQDDLTATGDILGTLRYMSPERFRGQCDASSDIYALGLTLYELLTLRPVFEANDRLKLIESIVNAKPLPLRSLDSSIPRDLETIVSKATALLPQDRFSSAQEMADDLRRFVNDEPILSRAPSPIEKLVRWTKRNQLIAALLALLIAVLSLSTLVMSQAYLSQRRLTTEKEQETIRANEASRRAEDSLELAELRGKELRGRLYSSEIGQASTMVNDPMGVELVRTKLLSWRPSHEPHEPDLRGWEWYYLDALTHDFEHQFKVDGAIIRGVEWLSPAEFIAHGYHMELNRWSLGSEPPANEIMRLSALVNETASAPDSNRVAFTLANQGNNFLLLDFDDLEVQWQKKIPYRHVDNLRWHPRESWLAGFESNHWMVWDGNDGELLLEGDLENSIENLAWNHLGQLVVSEIRKSQTWDVSEKRRIETGADSTQWVDFDPNGRCRVSIHRDRGAIERSTDGERWTRQIISSFCGRSRISPDTNWLALGRYEGGLEIWNTRTGALERQWIGQSGQITSIRWDDSSRRVLTGCEDGTLCVWDLAQQPTKQVLAKDLSVAQFSVDGTQMAVSERDKISIFDDDGNVQRVFKTDELAISDIAWNPDATELAVASTSGEIQTWDLSQQNPQLRHRIELDHQLPIQSITYAAEGTRLVVGSNEIGINVIDVTTGKLLKTFLGHNSGVFDLAEHPEGNWIASAGSNGEAMIWSLFGLSIRRRFRGHRGYVTSVAWSPNGEQLISGDENGGIILWEAETGDSVRSYYGHTRRVTSLGWSPTELRFVSAGEDSTIRIWDPDFDRALLNIDVGQVRGQRHNLKPDGRQILVSGQRGCLLLNADAAYSRMMQLTE
ncbi:MAG: protein kinase [Planctomycetota bacterium]